MTKIWSYSERYGQNVLFSNIKNCFLNNFNNFICDSFAIKYDIFNKFLNCQIPLIKDRGNIEILYCQSEIEKILKYTKKQAINELIKSKKINEKIDQITKFINGLGNGI